MRFFTGYADNGLILAYIADEDSERRYCVDPLGHRMVLSKKAFRRSFSPLGYILLAINAPFVWSAVNAYRRDRLIDAEAAEERKRLKDLQLKAIRREFGCGAVYDYGSMCWRLDNGISLEGDWTPGW